MVMSTDLPNKGTLFHPRFHLVYRECQPWLAENILQRCALS